MLMAGEADGALSALEPKYRPLQEAVYFQPVAGHPARSIYDRRTACDERTGCVSADADGITLTSQVLTLCFRDSSPCCVRGLGHDRPGPPTGQPARLRRRAGCVSGGVAGMGGGPAMWAAARWRCGGAVTYRDVSVVPELRQTLNFTMREDGFRWNWPGTAPSPFARRSRCLRLPLDLYQA